MKNVLLVMLVFQLIFPVLGGSAISPDPNGSVFRASMLEVKEHARETNRPYIVQFTAKWCMPCRWMESTTYKDERVVEFIANNFLAVKIDIDDFDGYAWKEYYGVKALPTLLVFSPEGKLLDKRDHSLSPSQMLGLLNQISEKIKDQDINTPMINEGSSLNAEDGDVMDKTEEALSAIESTSQDNLGTHVSYLQFGIFLDHENARKCYEQVSKNITFPVRMDEINTDENKVSFVIRSEGITDPDTEMNRITECDQKKINYLVKLERHDGQPDHSEYQKIVSRLGSNATL